MPTEPTPPNGTGAGASPRHPIRDGVVAAAILLSVAPVEPVPQVTMTNPPTDPTPRMSQAQPVPPEQPERLPLSPEEKDLGHWQELQREQREREAFDLANALRPPEQVEDRRRDTRTER